MTVRTLVAADADSRTIVYDPCTGQTRSATRPLPPGRQPLDDREVAGWPEIEPSALDSGWPVSLCWSPLVRCNLTCPHCLDDKTVPEVPATGRAAVAAVIAASGVLGVDVSGGEPLLLPEIPELAARLTRGGLAVSVTTNGWHLGRRAVDLVEHIDAVRVSFDGPDAASHDALRGPGSFDRAVDGVAAARTAGIAVQVQTVLRASLAPHHLQAVVDLAAGLDVHGVTFLQMLPLGEGAGLPDELLDDETARTRVGSLSTPAGFPVRLRTRAAAGNFTVVRADGQIWRNKPSALTINLEVPLTGPDALVLTGPDGSA